MKVETGNDMMQRRYTGAMVLTGIFLVAALALLNVRPARAQTTEPADRGVLRATLDRESAAIGDLVRLDLEYSLPPGARLPENPKIEGLDGLSVTSRVEENGHIKLSLLVDRLESWQSQAIKLTYLDRDGTEQVMEAEPVSLEVTSNLGEKPEEAAIKPIRDILPIRSPWLKYLPWAGGSAALLVVIAGLIWWRRRRGARNGPREAAEPPHLLARREMVRLESEGLFERGEIKRFYFTFSEILRRYMGAIRLFPASEYTTEEIVRQVGNHPQDRMVVPLLKQADQVKFADAAPTRARKDEDIKAALAYIDQTSPKENSEGKTDA